MKEIKTTLNEVIKSKADKEEVCTINNKVEELNKFMWKVLGVSSVAVVVLGTLATLLVNHLLK